MHPGNDGPDLEALIETLDRIASKPTWFSYAEIATFAQMAANTLRGEEPSSSRGAIGRMGHSEALRVYSGGHADND